MAIWLELLADDIEKELELAPISASLDALIALEELPSSITGSLENATELLVGGAISELLEPSVGIATLELVPLVSSGGLTISLILSLLQALAASAKNNTQSFFISRPPEPGNWCIGVGTSGAVITKLGQI